MPANYRGFPELRHRHGFAPSFYIMLGWPAGASRAGRVVVVAGGLAGAPTFEDTDMAFRTLMASCQAGRAAPLAGQLPALLALALVGCGSGGGGSGAAPDQANARVTITNTPVFLGARVTEMAASVAIDGPPPAAPVQAAGDPAMLEATALSLTLVREIAPPIVAGETVQATSIELRSASQAAVSYNFAGAPRLGAVDYVTGINQRNPQLSSSIAFSDSDVSAVSTDGDWVYAAEATDDPAFPFPAVFERFRIQGTSLVLEDTARLPLTSFAATSIMTTNDTVYATTGSAGEVFAFASNDLTPLGRFALNDARWVAWDSFGGRIVVAQGTPGHVEIAGGKAFVAAGTAGVQIVCLDDGSIVGSVPRPDPAALGLDPAVVVTNAVTVDRDLMFISNGEAGVYVAQADADFGATDCNAPQQITMLGHLRFDDLQSANHVAFKNDYLFVAAGLGGVKIVEVD
jgi:hypothetical protein